MSIEDNDKSVFESLNAINLSNHIEKKNGLSYLSWSFAWQEFKKVCPDAVYEIVKFDGVPYVETTLGLMCYTKVTTNNITHEMCLPVMDTFNQAMKSQPYDVQTRKGTRTVQAATMFDVNKTIMRCLVKNLAMFGLGLYIYAGEDLPDEEKQQLEKEQQEYNDLLPEINRIQALYNNNEIVSTLEAVKENPRTLHFMTTAWQTAIGTHLLNATRNIQELKQAFESLPSEIRSKMIHVKNEKIQQIKQELENANAA